MSRWRPVGAIARIAIQDQLRKGIWWLAPLAAVVQVFGGLSLNFFDVGVQQRLLVDFSLSGLGVLGLLLTAGLLAGSVPSEIEHKTIYTVLSKPVTRGQYLLGKFLGAMTLVWGNLAIAGGVLSAMITILFPQPGRLFPIMLGTVWGAIWLLCLECALLGAFTLLFSTVTTVPITLALTAMVYVVGRISAIYADYLLLISGNNPAVAALLSVSRGLLPHFDYFEIKDAAVHFYIVPWGYYWWVDVYGALYLSLALLVTAWIFQKRDL